MEGAEKYSLCNSNKDEFSVSLAAAFAFSLSSIERSGGGTSAFSNSIFSQFLYVASHE